MTFSFCLVLLVFSTQIVPAQYSGQPYPTPTPRATPKPVATPRPIPEQPPTAPPMTPTRPIYPQEYPKGVGPIRTPPTPINTKRKIRNSSAAPAERTIEVDRKVSVSLCVTSGTVKVNGWDREEIRAFVDGGSSVGFRVPTGSRFKDKKATTVQVMGYDPKEHKGIDLDECLDGKSIELDVPMGTALTIKSKESSISVEGVSKIVKLDNLNGEVSLRNIPNGIDATTFEGDLTVEEVGGPINLFASTGRMVVFDARPNEPGDPFRAKSRNGPISLQGVEHSNIDVSSTSGSLRFSGVLEAGGNYSFNTTSGRIELMLPVDTSCKVVSTYGGAFENQIPFKDVMTDNRPGGVRRTVALLGDGEAVLTVTTFNGSILIKPSKK